MKVIKSHRAILFMNVVNCIAYRLRFYKCGSLVVPFRMAKRKVPDPQKDEATREHRAIRTSIREPTKLLLTINLKPGAKKICITDLSVDSIGIQVCAQPRNGEANEELIKFLSRIVGIKKSSFTIEKGSKSRSKYISIDNCGLTEIELQKLFENEIFDS